MGVVRISTGRDGKCDFQKAILVTLDLLLGKTAGTATGAYIKAKRAEIKDAK